MSKLNVHITPKSSNSKTGPIPVTTTERKSCPPTCSWYDAGCYASYGPLRLHWNKVSSGERGVPWPDFIKWVKELPDGTLWRHNQAGDLPGSGTKISKAALHQLAMAASHTNGFTYTHKDYKTYADVLRMAISKGFIINTSCDTLEDGVVSYKTYGLPTTVMIPPKYQGQTTFKYKGVKIAQCIAEYKDTNCKDCMLCAKADRKVIVGFTPHGTGAKKVNDSLS